MELLIISSGLLWVATIANLLLIIGFARRLNNINISSHRAPHVDLLKIGDLAPAFKALNLQGDAVSLEDFKNQTVALMFFMPMCQPCREEIPRLQTLHDHAEDLGVHIVLVSTVEVAETQKFIDEASITLPVIVAPPTRNSLMHDYKVSGTPICYLINKQGEIAFAGFPAEPQWHQLITQWTASTAEREMALTQ